MVSLQAETRIDIQFRQRLSSYWWFFSLCLLWSVRDDHTKESNVSQTPKPSCGFPCYKWVESGDSLEWKNMLDFKILSSA